MEEICKVKDCGREVHAKGFCSRCYMRFRTRVMDEDGNFIQPLYGTTEIAHCRICGKEVGSGGSKGEELCAAHYAQRRRERIRRGGDKVGVVEYPVYEYAGELFSKGVSRDFGENRIIYLDEPTENGKTAFGSVLPLGVMDGDMKRIGVIQSIG